MLWYPRKGLETRQEFLEETPEEIKQADEFLERDNFNRVCTQIEGETFSDSKGLSCLFRNIRGEYVGEMRMNDEQPSDVSFFTRSGRSSVRNANLSYDKDKNVVIVKGKNSKIIFAPTSSIGDGLERDPFLRYEDENISGSHEQLRYQRDGYYPRTWVPTSMNTKQLMTGRPDWEEVPGEERQIMQLNKPPY